MVLYLFYESQVNSNIFSSTSVSSCDDSEKNDSMLDVTISVQSIIENNDSNNEETLFPLSIRGTGCHTQGVENKITLNFITYTNHFLLGKKCMLRKESVRELKYPYSIITVYLNENTGGYYFDVSNCRNIIRKLMPDERIRLTIDFRNIKVSRTS